ncbi:MAG: calcium/sodium antiporter [Dinoroseobacter sp.]|nr:calcium/sodium antiporter [Dinoroseobacter sp.]
MVILGLIILLAAGDFLVKGAVNLALRLGIPAFIVSLTVVAFGTSAPELLISVKAVLEDAPGIALGNVVGSNIANVLMVLGVPALFFGLQTADCDTKRSYQQMIAATVLFIVVCFLGPITWMHGLVLLAALFWMLWDATSEARAHKRANTATDAASEDVQDDEEEVEGADPDLPWTKILLYLALGLIGLPFGADLLLDGAVNIARAMGMSEAIIGLTLVAFGTSLPELAAVTAAAYRGHGDVALGNVFGSNMFNLLAIIGTAALFGDMRVPSEILNFDIWMMTAVTLVIAPIVYMRLNIGRVLGAVLTVAYAVYVVVLLT